MHIASIISLIILAACMIIWIFAAIKNSKFNKNMLTIMISTILVSIVTFAYFFEPNGGDLSQHYELLDLMKQGGWKFAKSESHYSSLFIYNTFAFLIAKNANYALLQTIPLIVDFAILLYIYFDVIKRNNFNSKTVSAKDSLFVFFLWITTFGLKLAITGIRCVLAVALCTLAIYNEYICKKNRLFSFAMYVAALFIHNFALWILIIRLAMIVKKKIVMAFAFFVVILFGQVVTQSLYDKVSNDYIEFIFSRILDTFNDFQFGSEHLQEAGSALHMVWGSFILLVFYLLYMSLFLKKHYKPMDASNKNEQEYTKNLFNACYTIGLLGLPMSFNYLYIERYMYLIAWAFLMISYYFLKTTRSCSSKKRDNFCIMTVMTFVCLFVVFFNDIYILIVNYLGYYFLAM